MFRHTRAYRRKATAIVAAATLTTASWAAFSASATAQDREHLDVQVFAEIPDPGFPEGIVVSDDGTVYVSTDEHVSGLPNPASKVFAFDSEGELLDEWEIEGQDDVSGMLGMELDGDGILYIVDKHPQRIIALDPDTGEQWDYATFEQVRDLCVPVSALNLVTECVYPDDLTFGPDGHLYVTDVGQSLLWRIPPGGGEAEVWFEDDQTFSVLGPNGIEFMDDGETLMFAMTLKGPGDTVGSLLSGDLARLAGGKIFTLTIESDGAAGELETFWEAGVGEGIDGFGIAASGNVYAGVGLGYDGVVAISPEGEEINRTPNVVENKLQDVPIDTPGNVKFLGERLLVTNHAPFVPLPGAFVVFDIYAGEPGMPPVRPHLPSA